MPLLALYGTLAFDEARADHVRAVTGAVLDLLDQVIEDRVVVAHVAHLVMPASTLSRASSCCRWIVHVVHAGDQRAAGAVDVTSPGVADCQRFDRGDLLALTSTDTGLGQGRGLRIEQAHVADAHRAGVAMRRLMLERT
jgi:hypothetical protein